MRRRWLLGEYRVREQIDLKQATRKIYRRLEDRISWAGDLAPDELLYAEAGQSGSWERGSQVWREDAILSRARAGAREERRRRRGEGDHAADPGERVKRVAWKRCARSIADLAVSSLIGTPADTVSCMRNDFLLFLR